MLTVITIIVIVVIAGGLVALYREVGLGRGDGSEGPVARPATSPTWPFGNLASGSHFAIPSDDPFTGFLAFVSDDQDALGEIYSAAVVAEEWGYPMLIAIAKTFRPTGWTDRLDGLPGNIGQYDLRVDEMQALAPASLPVVAFVNDGRVLGASVLLDSPSTIATTFQHCRSGLTR
ncbi:MAG: hypothetical protein QOJ25_1867 [Solirubrobacteraceae bacterium]|nr:hypothetical protein [Solirubrobacteraceae bacterium]